jgi:hypothetical protein
MVSRSSPVLYPRFKESWGNVLNPPRRVVKKALTPGRSGKAGITSGLTGDPSGFPNVLNEEVI